MPEEIMMDDALHVEHVAFHERFRTLTAQIHTIHEAREAAHQAQDHERQATLFQQEHALLTEVHDLISTFHLTDTQKEAIALSKFYEDKGLKDKQQMMSLLTVLIPAVVGLLAFSVKTLLTGLGAGATPAAESWMAGLAAGVAVVLSGYAGVITCEFVRHADQNYGKANGALAITDLPDQIKKLLRIKQSHGHYVAPVFLWLRGIAMALCVVSIGLLICIGFLGRESFKIWLQQAAEGLLHF
jgi:hypothetical protein